MLTVSRSKSQNASELRESRSQSAAQQRPYHHGQLREALLSTAFDLLQEQQAGLISLRQVAKHAGVSHAAPYHYFPDRQQLLLALAERCMEAFYQKQIDAYEEAGPDPVHQLIAIGEAYIQFALQHTNAFHLIFDPNLCTPDQPSPVHQANMELLRSTVERCMAQGSVPPQNPDVVAAGMWGTVHGLAQLILLGHLPAAAARPALQALNGLS